MLHLDYRDARPIYAQITEGIRQQAAQGILRQGEKLPSVRELAIELSINPNTIQRAYRELKAYSWWFHTADAQAAYIFISYTEPDSGLVELPEYRFGVFARPTLSTGIGVYASNTHTVEWLVEQGCFSWEELDDFVASANALGY